MRRKWAERGQHPRYCSERCRRRRTSKLDRTIDALILGRLAQIASSASICPSEIARRIEPDDWRPLMKRVRQAARRLARRDSLEICQGGQAIDPDDVRGPIRLRAKRG